METIERIFQAILFEMIVLSILIPTSVIIGGFKAEKMIVVAIGLSLFAVFWNYIYNIIFDNFMGRNRSERGLAARCIHAVGFELGMIAITLPVIAWYLNITWIAALILEAGFLIFILVYTLIFNILYDRYQPYQKWFSK